MTRLFHRQKIAMGLLQACGGNLGNLDMQRRLRQFTTNEQTSPSYEFILRKFGWLSYQSLADKKKLAELEVLEWSPNWKIKRDFDYLSLLTEDEQQSVRRVSRGDFEPDFISSTNGFSIRSASKEGVYLYTIGYEGHSLENFVNRLLKHEIPILCDVRKNPISRKFGFSKNTLGRILRNADIHYIHMPNLGIDAASRRDLHTTEARAKLFRNYEVTTLNEKKDELRSLMELLDQYGRLAVTCFEADHSTCHRHVLANRLHRESEERYKILHI